MDMNINNFQKVLHWIEEDASINKSGTGLIPNQSPPDIWHKLLHPSSNVYSYQEVDRADFDTIYWYITTIYC
jgi:hypothetical protein